MNPSFSTPEILEALPYTILALGAFVLLITAFLGKNQESTILYRVLSIGFVVAATGSLFFTGIVEFPLYGALTHDSIGFPFAIVILFLLLLAFFVVPYDSISLNEAPSSITSLLLLSACGGLMMVYANHLLVFFVGLELLSLPLYVLTGLGQRTSQSSEAAFKYFLLGSIASAIFIYGASLMWASIGTLRIDEISEIFSTKLVDHSSTTLWMGVVFVVVSLLFKLGVFPFQFWVPDVYQSAPASIVAWMSGTTKAATVVLLLRILSPLPESVAHYWIVPLSVLAMGSMLFGSIGALFQEHVRRLLGYSTIAHAGYAMIGVVCAVGSPLQTIAPAIAFYFLAYGTASLVAFTIANREELSKNILLKDYAGLGRRSPIMAFAMTLALLSLAGLPPLGGFLGKFNIFFSAINQGYTSLVIVAVMTSLVSLGYYLHFLVKIYMEGADGEKLSLYWSMAPVVICVSSGFLLFLGLYPKPLFELFGLFIS